MAPCSPTAGRFEQTEAAGISFADVSVVFPDGTLALRNLDLSIAAGELVVLVGPSGCGKSTALRALAGLQPISTGQVLIGERDVTRLDPQDRDIAMVFQNYALYPHKSVYENLAYPLRVRHAGRAEIDSRVRRTAEFLALTPFLSRRPWALSGGQRQRVAMGRALVRQPAAFLMDEPLSNLDAALRVEMRTEILALQRRLGVTTVYVTHDQVEAMTMGDRVAVMRGGVLQQFDRPQVLYQQPRNLFVANFVGSPSMNLMMAYVLPDRSGITVAGQAIRPSSLQRNSLARLEPGSPIVAGVRPEAFDNRQSPEHDVSITVVPSLVEFLGSELFVHFGLGGPVVGAPELLDADALPKVDGVSVGKPLVARLAPTCRCLAGESLTLWFSSSQVLFFLPEDGSSLDADQALA